MSLPAGLREDLFTADAKPLDISPVADPATSVTATIGSAGGQLAATGPDGTTYTLAIPAESVPDTTIVTMIPYADVGGFPGLAPEHRVGVALYPEGLELAVPGMLTITPTGPLPAAEVATLRSRSDGHDASFVLHSVADGAATVQIPHFSGWIAVYPIKDIDVRSVINEFVSDAAAEFEENIYELSRVDQQKQMIGTPEEERLYAPGKELDSLVKMYDRDVLQLYLLAASSGCFEAGRAIRAYVAYARIMQLIGAAEDPRYARPIPESLLETRWSLCSSEEFERCAQTGDFPAFQSFLLQVYRQSEMSGQESLPEVWQAEGMDYLRRCGHWNARIDGFIQVEANVPAVIEEVAVDVPLQWQPGLGPFGMFRATISGDADHVVKKEVDVVRCLDFFTDGSTTGHQTQTRATAEITGISFDEPPWYLPGTMPLARGLELQFDLGVFTFMSQGCQPITGAGGADMIVWRLQYDNLAQITNVLHPTYQGKVAPGDINSKLWAIKDGWQFDDGPYRAIIVQAGEETGGGVSRASRLEVIVEHTPQ